MLILELNARQNRSLFSSGYRVRIDAKLKSPAQTSGSQPTIPIALLLERIFKYCPLVVSKITQAELTDESGRPLRLIENLRGRPPESFPRGSTIGGTHLGKSEELFYSDGVLFEPPENIDDYPETVEELKQVPFNYQVETTFHSYTGSHRLRHAVSDKQSPELQAAVDRFDLAALFRMIPAKVMKTRIGLEQYRPTWVSSALGQALSVQERFYLEVTPDAISIFAEIAWGGAKGALPFTAEALFPALDRSLQELDLFSGLSRQIASRLS